MPDDNGLRVQITAELHDLKTKNNRLTHELAKKEEEILRIKANAKNLQVKVEEEEEKITNNLLKKLEAVTKKKETLAKQLEAEEEFMTNTLKKKLDQVRREKVELELRLETEQEYFVNKLQKELLQITRQKNALERKLNEGRSVIISKLEHSVDVCKESLESSAEMASVEQLELKVRGIRKHQTEVEAEARDYREKCEALAKQLEVLSNEKFIIEAKTNRYKEKLEQLKLEREHEFSQFELSEERQFNLSIRRQSIGDDDPMSTRSKSMQILPKEGKQVDSGRPRAQSDKLFYNKHNPPSGSPSTSCRSSPGMSLVPTPRSEPSPKRRSEKMTPREEIKRHTEEVLNMSPSITSSAVPSPGASPRCVSPAPTNGVIV